MLDCNIGPLILGASHSKEHAVRLEVWHERFGNGIVAHLTFSEASALVRWITTHLSALGAASGRASALDLALFLDADRAAAADMFVELDCVTALRAAASARECSCETCSPQDISHPRFIVCRICGNKRCPHATDCRNPCTNSNAPGQKGSSWENCK